MAAWGAIGIPRFMANASLPYACQGYKPTPSIGGAICDEDKAPSDPSGVIFGNDVTYEFTVQ